MDKPKIKWSSIIVVDVLLVNIAFLFAYLTSLQFGFDFLEQSVPLFALLQSADVTPPPAFFGCRRCRHDSPHRFFIRV